MQAPVLHRQALLAVRLRDVWRICLSLKEARSARARARAKVGGHSPTWGMGNETETKTKECGGHSEGEGTEGGALERWGARKRRKGGYIYPRGRRRNKGETRAQGGTMEKRGRREEQRRSEGARRNNGEAGNSAGSSSKRAPGQAQRVKTYLPGRRSENKGSRSPITNLIGVLSRVNSRTC